MSTVASEANNQSLKSIPGPYVLATVAACLLATSLVWFIAYLIHVCGPYPPYAADLPAEFIRDLITESTGNETDRYQYWVGLLVYPLACWGLILLLGKILTRLPDTTWKPYLMLLCTHGGWVGSLGFLGLTVIGLWHDRWIHIAHSPGLQFPILGILWGGVIHGLVRLTAGPGQRGWSLSLACDVLAGLFLGWIFFYTLFDEAYISRATSAAISFNAVFYMAVQVEYGQAILIDCIHQYGLYPHFLYPIFRVIGFSVFKYSLVMQALTAIELAIVYLVLRNQTQNRLIALLGLSSLVCGLSVGRIFDSPVGHVYYQYVPIRTLTPALLLGGATLFLYKPSSLWHWLTWQAVSVGCLWNTDTGIVCWLTWGLTLGYREFCQRPNWGARLLHGFGHIIPGVLSLLASYASFAVLMRWGYGIWPDFTMGARFQKLYYLYGFFMLPMQLWGVWMVPLAIYMVGLARACCLLSLQRATPRDILTFLLCILGAGVFSYFQGRSHPGNEQGVSYPAVLLVCLFSDSVLRANSGWGWSWKVAGGIACGVMGVSWLSFGAALPKMCQHLTYQLGDQARWRAWENERKFLQQYAGPGTKTIILSLRNSGVDYWASGSPPLAGFPNQIEMVLVEDYDKFTKLCVEHPDWQVIFRQRDVGVPNYVDLLNSVVKHRELIATSESEQLVCYGPLKEKASPPAVPEINR